MSSAIYNSAYFERQTIEMDYYRRGQLRNDEELILQYVQGPKVLSVGCGLGRLEHLIVGKDMQVTAVDVADLREYTDFSLILGGMDAIPDEHWDTVFFCESIEHIWAEEFDRNWGKIKKNLGRLIVANWEHYHPIYPNGWDHVRTIDDAVYDWLAGQAKTVVYRKGSHLVLDF